MRASAYDPDWAPLPNDPDYEARASYEAALHTERAKALYAKNERRLKRARERAQRAEERARQAEAKPGFSKSELRKLWTAVERRRDELQAIEREMEATPAGSQHRGRKSYRKVPSDRR